MKDCKRTGSLMTSFFVPVGIPLLILIHVWHPAFIAGSVPGPVTALLVGSRGLERGVLRSAKEI